MKIYTRRELHTPTGYLFSLSRSSESDIDLILPAGYFVRNDKELGNEIWLKGHEHQGEQCLIRRNAQGRFFVTSPIILASGESAPDVAL